MTESKKKKQGRRKKNVSELTEAEWEIMEVLWHRAPLSAAEVFEMLGPETSWNVKTVRAFLDRLEQKEAVRKEKVHGINVFRPVPERERCLREESRTFLDRFFRGNPVSMMSHFLENEGLSEEEIQRLQQLLEAKVPTDKN